MSKEKAINKINQAIFLIKPYFEGNLEAKRFTLKYLDDALKELEEQNMYKIYKGEIQRLMPIFQAMADGRIIQVSENGNEWIDIDGEEEGLFLDTLIDNPQYYRIKPEQRYRPFKNAEECWSEMQKHKPFGWVNYNGYRANIAAVMGSAITFVNNKGYTLFFQQAFEGCTFIDKQPFGIKEK